MPVDPRCMDGAAKEYNCESVQEVRDFQCHRWDRRHLLWEDRRDGKKEDKDEVQEQMYTDSNFPQTEEEYGHLFDSKSEGEKEKFYRFTEVMVKSNCENIKSQTPKFYHSYIQICPKNKGKILKFARCPCHDLMQILIPHRVNNKLYQINLFILKLNFV